MSATEFKVLEMPEECSRERAKKLEELRGRACEVESCRLPLSIHNPHSKCCRCITLETHNTLKKEMRQAEIEESLRIVRR